MSGNVPIFLGGGRGEVTENCGRWRSGIQTCLGSLQEEMMSTRLLFFSVVGMYFIFWNSLSFFKRDGRR